MTNRPTLKVSKTDAARRQIETAIRLWFFSGDPVSIHTLAAAAHQVLHDIGKGRGFPTALRNLPGVRPEAIKRLRKLVSRYENFFKHADHDADALLDFNPEATEVFLLDAVTTYESLTQEVVPILSTFKAWMFLQNPKLMEEKAKLALDKKLDGAGIDFKSIPKAEFFTEFQSVLMKYGIT
jgi:hypothetical protein